MTNHQQQVQDQDQVTMVSMDSHKNPNLDTTNNNKHHVLSSPSSSSQDLYHQKHIHIPNNTLEDKGFIFNNNNNNNNNNQVMIKNPNFLSSTTTTLASKEGYTIPPPPPPPSPPSPPLQHYKKVQHQKHTHVLNKIDEKEGDFTTKNNTNSLSCSSPAAAGEEAVVVEESGRDRLKRHRVEMAGRVRIPDIWGHEDLLKDWIDCTVFDSSLGNNSIMSARAALVQERRSTLRIQNQC